MVETVGEHIKPHLEQLYQHVIGAAQAVKGGATLDEALAPAEKAARVATYFDEAEKEFKDKQAFSIKKLIKATPEKVWDVSYNECGEFREVNHLTQYGPVSHVR